MDMCSFVQVAFQFFTTHVCVSGPVIFGVRTVRMTQKQCDVNSKIILVSGELCSREPMLRGGLGVHS